MIFWETLIFSLVILISECCRWPNSDVLFIIDSSLHIKPADFQRELDFVAKSIDQMDLSPAGSRVSLAMFTPMGRFVFPFSDQANRRDLQSRIQSTTYAPCDPNTSPTRCLPCASVNSIAKFALAQGNRKPFPDVIVVISGGKYQIPELLNKEVLLSPNSPIHAFYILVDGTYPQIADQHYAATANTLKVKSIK
ncbi:unnamed protein product, partial [Mesorhabditis belari]|uniref:VWFA domain-containing protein n=1 Tax=Mesorhabditis belari TaxID=2138241 RepID=A0AAF3FNJ2_9BILA